jgi:hypothetical protein
MQVPTIYFDKSPSIKIVFSSLLIDVKKISEQFGSIKKFDQKCHPWVLTNGKIHVIAEMSQPATELEAFVQKELVPHGFENGKDYALVYERLTSQCTFHFFSDFFIFLGCTDWLPSL